MNRGLKTARRSSGSSCITSPALRFLKGESGSPEKKERWEMMGREIEVRGEDSQRGSYDQIARGGGRSLNPS